MRVKIITNWSIAEVELELDLLPPLGTFIFLDDFYHGKVIDVLHEVGSDSEQPQYLESIWLRKDKKGIYYALYFCISYD